MKAFEQIYLFFIFCILSSAGTCQAEQADSNSLPLQQPKICLGLYDVEGRKEWGVPSNGLCPPGHAIYGAKMGFRFLFSPAKTVNCHPTCCPLPADDILTEQHRWVLSTCPQNYVATGANRVCPMPLDGKGKRPRFCDHKIRCTLINLDRYQLGMTTSGALWGNSSVQWQEKFHFFKIDTPAALRYALGRQSRYSWAINGCLGYPFGSLLIGKRTGRCRHQLFQRLEYRGNNSDPPQGTAVIMFPDCDALSSYTDPEPRCLKYEK